MQRMRELALKASSDQFADECGQLDAEYQQLLEELNRIGNSKAFDGKALFGAAQTEGPDTLRVSQEEITRYFEALDVETARIAAEGLEGEDTLNRHLAEFARAHFAAHPPQGSGKADAAYYRVTFSKDSVTVAFGRPDLSAFGLGGTSLANAESAREAIGRLDGALQTAAQRRGDYGATQSKMEHVVSYLNQLEEILSGVLSRIRDADMAKEIMTYLREQVVGQATAYAMAHSNERTDGLVSLLKQA